MHNFWLDPSSTSILYVCKQRMLWLAYIISRAGSNILVQELTLIQYTCVETALVRLHGWADSLEPLLFAKVLFLHRLAKLFNEIL